jgi:hypothetical protein
MSRLPSGRKAYLAQRGQIMIDYLGAAGITIPMEEEAIRGAWGCSAEAALVYPELDEGYQQGPG